MAVNSKKSFNMAPIKRVKPRPEWQWKVLKLLILAVCLILFTWQFSYIFRDHLDGKTTITTEQGHCCQIARIDCQFVKQKSFTRHYFISNSTSYLVTLQKVYDSLALPAITICAPPFAEGNNSSNCIFYH